MNNVTGVKISEFNIASSITEASVIPFVQSGTNLAITFESLKSALGVTGQLKSEGVGVSILNKPSSFVNYIASIKGENGISTQKVNGDVVIKNNFQNGAGGIATIQSLSATPTVFKSIQAGRNVTLTDNGTNIKIDAENTTQFVYRKVVRDAADLSGALRSDTVYIVDGVIDMGSTSIRPPSGGLNIVGSTFNVSKLVSSANNYNMFSALSCGSIVMQNLSIEVTGTNSKVYNCTASSGNEAIELTSINYNDCTSLGSLAGFRQFLETGTGRFGGKPSLTLAGDWAGGLRIDTSIVRNVSGMTEPLFKAGGSFVMQSRFALSINVDLGATAPLFDFSAANFPNDLTLQIKDCIVTRNGVRDSSDTTLYPNIDHTAAASFWSDNVGMPNTNESGSLSITSDAVTSILTASTPVDVEGTFTLGSSTHFDEAANGQLRYTVDTERQFLVSAVSQISGTTGDEIELIVVKRDVSAGTDSVVASQVVTVPNFAGAPDVANFVIIDTVSLENGDYLRLQVQNNSSTNNVTALDSTKMITTKL